MNMPARLIDAESIPAGRSAIVNEIVEALPSSRAEGRVSLTMTCRVVCTKEALRS